MSLYKVSCLHTLVVTYCFVIVTIIKIEFVLNWFNSIRVGLRISVVVVWKGIHSRSDTNRTGAGGLSFYYHRPLCCPDQTLAMMLLSQHRVSSSKTVRSRAPRGAPCMGHAIRMWSAVCLEALHSQFAEGARPHLCMDEWNRPTPFLKRLSLTQAAQDRPIPAGLAPVLGTKIRNLEAFSQYSAFHLRFVHSEARMPSPARLSK